MKLLEAEGMTHIGLKRTNNQDYFLINFNYNLCIVADGMGGHQLGEVASIIAVNVFEKKFKDMVDKGISVNYALKNAAEQANKIIYDYSRKRLCFDKMGTTLTASAIRNNSLHIAHIGDSRAYLINETSVTLLTPDHSYVGELLRSGNISEKDAEIHPMKNILTKALGIESDISFDILEFPFKKSNYLLLCTDGLYNAVGKKEMQEIIFSDSNLKQSASSLIDKALSRGGNDNITVVLVDNR